MGYEVRCYRILIQKAMAAASVFRAGQQQHVVVKNEAKDIVEDFYRVKDKGSFKSYKISRLIF